MEEETIGALGKSESRGDCGERSQEIVPSSKRAGDEDVRKEH